MFFSEIDFPASDRGIVVWWMTVTKINMADDEETNVVRYFYLSIDS